MTTDDILRMAREAGKYADEDYARRWETGEGGSWSQIRDERFASIATAHEREARQSAQRQVAELQERLNRADAERCAAVLAERDECAIIGAKTMEDMGRKAGGTIFADGQVIADAIRARGTK